jgi:hypothetical protein
MQPARNAIVAQPMDSILCVLFGCAVKSGHTVCCDYVNTDVLSIERHHPTVPLPHVSSASLLSHCRALRRKIGGTARDYWKDWVSLKHVNHHCMYCQQRFRMQSAIAAGQSAKIGMQSTLKYTKIHLKLAKGTHEVAALGNGRMLLKRMCCCADNVEHEHVAEVSLLLPVHTANATAVAATAAVF